MTTSRWDSRWPSRDETGTLATRSVVSHHQMSRPSERCGSVGSLLADGDVDLAGGLGQLERDLLAGVGRADDEDPALGQVLRAPVVGAVELRHARVELVGDRRA